MLQATQGQSAESNALDDHRRLRTVQADAFSGETTTQIQTNEQTMEKGKRHWATHSRASLQQQFEQLKRDQPRPWTANDTLL